MMDHDFNEVAISSHLKRHWGWLLALGILFIVLGMLALGMLVSVTLASMIMMGIILVIAGVSQLVNAFKYKSWKGFFGHILIALLYLVGGVLVIYDPVLASTLITAMLAWILIVIGITRLVMAFTLRQTRGWMWIVLAGIASIVMGVIILSNWPISGLWVIGLFIAIELLMSGWSYVFLALGLRSLVH